MLVPVILSGGKGTRLWPVSREAHPKPFIKLADGMSLLQTTIRRCAENIDIDRLLIVTNREHYFQTHDEIEKIGEYVDGKSVSYLLEPFGRNTAPAAALAALKLRDELGPDAIMLVLPSDHVIDDPAAFCEAAKRAEEAARSGRLVTFGITPTLPETGYGYIEAGEEVAAGGVYAVSRFVEKPDLERAKEFLASGGFYWNSGMFCFRVGDLLEAFKTHAPEIYRDVEATWQATLAHKSESPSVQHIDADAFSEVTDISIDYAVMEKSPEIAVITGEFGWSDVGSWQSFSDLVSPDENGNRIIGEGVAVESKNNYVQSDGRLVALVGVEDLVVIDTPDAVLVGHRGSSQGVKEVVEKLRREKHEAASLHRTVHRPWGTYTVLEEGEGFKMKRIVVKPKAQLSLQMHHHRSEHWVVVSGTAEVVNGESTIRLEKDQSTYIPAGHKHRIKNIGDTDLVFIEVQTGEYLGEDDIVRFEDNYGRA